MTLHALGTSRSVGDHETAGKDYERAIAILDEQPPDSSFPPMARYSLGQNLRHRGKLPEAIAMLEGVLAARDRGERPAAGEGRERARLARRCYIDEKDYAKALDLARQALAIREKVLGPTAGDVADYSPSPTSSSCATTAARRSRPRTRRSRSRTATLELPRACSLRVTRRSRAPRATRPATAP